MLKYKRYYIYVGIVCVLFISIFSINNILKSNDDINPNIAFLDDINEPVKEDEEYFYVDVKGAVKTPGVYKATSKMIVNDVIKLAGGLSKNAYTKNINLALKVKEGMVIYVYNKNELTTTKILNDVKYSTPSSSDISDDNISIDNGLININTASKEELMTLTGIGESKAIAIIEYRNNNKFNTIEDIMNVSGIGESAFAKIKSNITV